MGARAILALAGHAGLANQPNVPSLALGSGLVTPMGLTAAYAAFANGGDAVRPRAIQRVLDQDGGVVLAEPVERERVLSVEVAFQMTSLMQDVIARGTGTSVQRWGVRVPVAGKTGSTNEFKDAWFVGYSSTRSSSASGWASTSRRPSPGTPSAGASPRRSGPTS